MNGSAKSETPGIPDNLLDWFTVGRTRRNVRFDTLSGKPIHVPGACMPSLVCGWVPLQKILFQSLS